MHATVRRYDGVDETRRDELTKKVNEALIPRLSKLPGFSGYYLVEAERGVMTSISLFDSQEHADESTRLRGQLDPRREARGCAPQPAEDHLRQGDRAEDEWRRHRRLSTTSPDRGRPAGRACPTGATRVIPVANGAFKWFNRASGSGTNLEPDEGGDGLFVTERCLDESVPRLGERVEFEWREGSMGREAMNVSVCTERKQYRG